MQRQIERTSELMDQLEEQMARVNLTEEESKTRVLELTAATPASIGRTCAAKDVGDRWPARPRSGQRTGFAA